MKFTTPEKIFLYKYKCETNSLLYHYFFKMLSKRILNLIPVHIPGNLLTFAGHFCSWVAFAFMMGLFGDVKGYVTRSTYWFLFPALGILIYYTLDSIDGAQARRNNSSSPLGEFYDHWLDSFSSFMLPLGIISVFDVNDYISVPIIVAGVYAFWVTMWDQNKTEILKLRKIGAIEGVLIVVGFYSFSAVGGMQIWLVKDPILGLSGLEYLAIIAFITLTVTSILPLLSNIAKFSQSLGLSLGLSLVLIWYLVLKNQPETQKFENSALILSLLGLIGCKYIGDMQRNRLIGTVYQTYDMTLIAFGVGLIISSIIIPKYKVQLLFGYLYLAVIIFKLAYQFFNTTSFISKKLGLNSLGLKLYE